MPQFRVHFNTEERSKDCFIVTAKTPEEAAKYVRRKFEGAIVTKVKVNKARKEVK